MNMPQNTAPESYYNDQTEVRAKSREGKNFISPFWEFVKCSSYTHKVLFSIPHYVLAKIKKKTCTVREIKKKFSLKRKKSNKKVLFFFPNKFSILHFDSLSLQMKRQRDSYICQLVLLPPGTFAN
jgi:hypothetical protein